MLESLQNMNSSGIGAFAISSSSSWFHGKWPTRSPSLSCTLSLPPADYALTFSPDWLIETSIIILESLIWPIILTITIALKIVLHSQQFDILFPIMNEERAIPMILMLIPLLSAPFFFLASIFLLTPISILPLLPCFPMQPMSDYNTRPRRSSRAVAFPYQAFSFGVIGSYLMLGIYRCVLLSRFLC